MQSQVHSIANSIVHSLFCINWGMQIGGEIGHYLVEDVIWKICVQFPLRNDVSENSLFSEIICCTENWSSCEHKRVPHSTSHLTSNHQRKCTFCMWPTQQFQAILFLQLDYPDFRSIFNSEKDFDCGSLMNEKSSLFINYLLSNFGRPTVREDKDQCRSIDARHHLLLRQSPFDAMSKS